jgi:hypothetical protein
MEIFGYKISRANGKQAESFNQLPKKGKSVLDKITITHLDRTKAEISHWRNALDAWENPLLRDRLEMYRLYQEIALDDQVTTKLQTIVNSITGSEFEVYTGETLNEEKTELFRGEWFTKFIRFFVEAEMYGFSLVELTETEHLGYKAGKVLLIPRENVKPEKEAVLVSLYSHDLIPFNNTVIGIGDAYDKGLFCQIAPIYIYKKNALAYWANYQSKFGIPPVVAKTDLSNDERKRDLAAFLTQMRSNSFLVADRDDEIMQLDAGSNDGFQTFLNLINLCNESISKVMDGQTMTSDNGSSYSQSEVHERVADSFLMSRLRKLERIVNGKLIPKMAADGLGLTENDKFYFKKTDESGETIDKVLKLSQAGYKVDAEWLSETTGIPLTSVELFKPNIERAQNYFF